MSRRRRLPRGWADQCRVRGNWGRLSYEVADVEDEDYGSAVHREAEKLFWALRPLKRIYQEAVRKHIIQAKLETEVIGRRLSPERILTFAPSYNGLVRRRLRAQWGKWINW
jgi:hypothetical protein